MKISINNLQSIVLGREKDCGVKTIEIDCSEWKEKFPQLTKYRIEVTSPNGIIYCPEVTMNEHILTWPITKSDTALTGKGAYQIVATGENDERRTSAHLSLNIYSIMPGTAQETPPEYIESWVQNIVDTAERAELAAKKAEDAAAGIVITPEEIQNAVNNYLIKNPIEVEETDPTVPNWAKAEKKPTYTAEEIGAQPKGDYALKSEIPQVPDIPVTSVNGKTGDVKLSAADVGALPKDTPIPGPYTLPTASAEVKGGAKVGNGLRMDGDVMSVVPRACELINEITVEETVEALVIDEDMNGNPFELVTAVGRITCGGDVEEGKSTGQIGFMTKESITLGRAYVVNWEYPGYKISDTNRRSSVFAAEIDLRDGIRNIQGIAGDEGNAMEETFAFSGESLVFDLSHTVGRIGFELTIPKNAKISVYGIRKVNEHA